MSRHSTRRFSWWMRCLAVCALSGAMANGAMAAQKYGAKPGGGKKSSESNNNTPPPPPPTTAQTDQNQQELTAARAERTKAEENLASVTARLREEFDKSPAMAQAQADVKSAQAAYETASKPALDTVHATPEYKAASDAKARDQAQIEQLRSTPGSESQIADLARDSMTQGAAATKLENEAVSKDPAAQGAKTKVASANLQLSQLRGQFNATLTQNADWVAAKKALDDATQKLQAAQASHH